MEKVVLFAGLVVFIAGVTALVLWVRATVRRDKALDAEAIAGTQANKLRAEEAHVGSHRRHDDDQASKAISEDDEKVWERTDREFEEKWGAFMREPTHQWARTKLIEDFREIHDIYERYGQNRISLIDAVSVAVGQYSSPEELKVEMMLEEHTGNYQAVSAAIEAEYQDHVSNTYRWTETDEILLREMLDGVEKTNA